MNRPSWKRRVCRCPLTVMIGGTVIILVLIGVVVGISQDNGEQEKELKMVHIIMRHGIRTPADTYPNDPYINDTLYPIGWGQLTNEGKQQLYEIGKFFRQRYNSFLGDHYWPDEFYTQSTDVDRTKASMQLVNAGLWPPKSVQTWGPLDWQPIPVHSEPLSQDMLLLVRKPCAAYHIERDRVVASQEIQDKLKSSQQLFDDLTNYTGRSVKDFDDVQDLFSTLKAEEGINLTLPEWTNKYYPDQMLEPTVFSYILNSWNDKLNRLKGGVLLKKIIQDWQSKVNDTISPKSRKAFLYGGHDSTIVNLMRTLKVWDPQLPDYAITILLEFSQDSHGLYGVEVFLRNSTVVPPFKLTIPGCDSFCSLDKLEELTKEVIPDNWEEECNIDDSYVVPEPGGP
ncbi:prostatic acid phosphatase-like isoform X2 [Sitophilus oryzae]|uniref:Prostatic acid phosphatase-like isoform X2 n=1 Tax=Sitophilus oryzae TaxID=7048 RepID=A0A6J2X8G9_SITOR|nr:prostatic acid phosphatase-like isoform X2 [Sitophilus oryzae]